MKPMQAIQIVPMFKGAAYAAVSDGQVVAAANTRAECVAKAYEGAKTTEVSVDSK